MPEDSIISWLLLLVAGGWGLWSFAKAAYKAYEEQELEYQIARELEEVDAWFTLGK